MRNWYLTEEILTKKVQERIKQTYGHGEREGEGEMYGKSNMETYITVCKIDSQQEFAVWLRKLEQRLCINLERVGLGGGFRRKGMYVCL